MSYRDAETSIVTSILFKDIPQEEAKLLTDKNHGFVGVYTDYPDKPWLNGKLFLLFRLTDDERDSFRRDKYLSKHPLLYGQYYLKERCNVNVVYAFFYNCEHLKERHSLPLEYSFDWWGYIKKKNRGLSV